MADPIACPHCHAILTDSQIQRMHQQYASAQRKVRSGGHNGGRPPRYPERRIVAGFRCPNGCELNERNYRIGDQCIDCLSFLVREYDPRHQTPQQALDAARRHSNAVLRVGPESERQIVPIEEI